jgi:hypothetical protein
MSYENGCLSPSDVALLQNRNSDGFGGFGGDGAWWIVLFLIFAMGGWGNNNGFGGGFNGGVGNEYAWLSNGQKEIMQNTNQGFDTLQLSNQLNNLNTGVQGISTQICNSTADINSNLCSGFAGVNQTISSGFANAETAANARQMANMQQGFNNQIATLQGFNGVQQSFNQLGSQFADCCCENRLATCQTQNIIQNESNATRFADANNTRDIIENANRNNQAILDKLCQLELDNVKAQLEAKNDLIGQLRQENLYARGQASQVQQTADIRLSEEQQFDNFYNRLKNCPVNAVSVYGNQPVFSCQPNTNCGCGCGNF